MDFLPAGYQYGPNSSSDPVFQQAYAQWMAATSQQTLTSTVPSASYLGSGLLSDIWTMAESPWATTTGLVSGIGETFMDGSAADSLGGATAQMVDTMFGWTDIPIFQVENYGPIFGNIDDFQNGQTVGVVWGTANNLAIMYYSLANLPANIQNLINTGGSLVGTTGEGLQIVISGTVTVEAVVPVVINVAGAIDATLAIASTGLPSGGTNTNGPTGNSTTINIGEHALQPDHNWSQIFGNPTPTLSDISTYVNSILSNPNWTVIGDAHGPGGVVIGQILEAQQDFNGVTVWVRAFKALNGNIIVNNAGVL